MPDTTSNNKRIAKNTMFLYLRMLFSMAVSLYTSRVILNVLGVVDYGINNVVGGLVVMFSFLNGTMVVSTQRFLSYDMGKNDVEMINKTFNIAMVIHVSIAIFVLVLGETIGLWLLNNKLIIPSDRLYAANWVYQFSLITFMLNITQAPYTACINAHEKMNVYAYFSIIDVALKLFIAFAIQWVDFDKLISLSVMQSIVSMLVLFLYRFYCYKNYDETKLRRVWHQQRFKEMLKFAGWNTSAHFALMARTQGVNILLNMFFGPIYNAARGIAVTIFTQISGFVSNFVAAMSPQIVKYYASGDINSMHELVTRGCKYSFFLLYIFVLPLVLETEYILKIWLGTPPEYASLFCRLVLLSAMIDVLSSMLLYGVLATGIVKVYQIVMSSLFLLVPILTYIAYKCGAKPEICIYIEMVMYLMAVLLRPILMGKITGYRFSFFLKESVLRNIFVVLVSSPFPIFVTCYFPSGVFRLFMVCLTSFVSVALSVWFVGLKNGERNIVISIVKKKLNA